MPRCTGPEKRGTAKNHCQRDSRPHTQEAERRNEAKRTMSIQGSQLARQASIRSIIGRRQASITSIIGDTLLHWRVVSGPTRWSPKKAPAGAPLNPCIARGLAAKTGPEWPPVRGVPPPIPPKPSGRTSSDN